MELYIRQGRRYRPASPNVVRQAAAEYALEEIKGEKLTSPAVTRRFLKELLAGREHEVFVMISINIRNRVIETHELFRGTIDQAHVYPREVVKTALADNAAAAVMALDVNLSPFIGAHARGDWGDVTPDDRQANEDALREGGRLFSAYTLPHGEQLWVITEADRSATTVLLPDDY